MSHPKSYFDRTPTITTPEQMFARLHERVVTAHAKVRISSPRLQWERVEKNPAALKSNCGKYSVFKTTVFGKTTYSVARLTGSKGLIASELKTGEEAKKMAQAYADSLAREARGALP